MEETLYYRPFVLVFVIFRFTFSRCSLLNTPKTLDKLNNSVTVACKSIETDHK